ncbi:MAG: hypothetical protein KAS72_15210 [Phycisphaerales bacterium]|nr:hypothetical protein [Phycisphaerales bacterium]
MTNTHVHDATMGRTIRKATRTAAILGFTSVLLLTGCADNKSASDVASGARHEAAEPVVRVPAEPEWYSDLPGTEDAIYVTATRVSPDRQMAENMAENQARADLAQHLSIMVSTLQRDFDEQINVAGDLELLQTSQVVVESVTHTILEGTYVDKKETHLTDKDYYRVFIRMVLDRNIVRERYLEEIKKHKELETRLRSTEAFQQLERKVADYREETEAGG